MSRREAQSGANRHNPVKVRTEADELILGSNEGSPHISFFVPMPPRSRNLPAASILPSTQKRSRLLVVKPFQHVYFAVCET